MKLGDYTTIVKDLIDDSTAVVDQRVIDSLNYLSNIFSIPSVDTSQSTVVAAQTVAMPALATSISDVFLASELIPMIKDSSEIENAIYTGLQRWYIANQVIQFTVAFDDVYQVRINYEKGFIQPAVAVDTDLPKRLDELVTLGAVARYYDKLKFSVITNRQKYPDVNPDEINTLAKLAWENYQKLITQIKLNGKTI